jgi:hypothetical protein
MSSAALRGEENAPLAAELADRFTVYNYARRGRGESGDTEADPKAVATVLQRFLNG